MTSYGSIDMGTYFLKLNNESLAAEGAVGEYCKARPPSGGTCSICPPWAETRIQSWLGGFFKPSQFLALKTF
jgi:hypothetical protein